MARTDFVRSDLRSAGRSDGSLTTHAKRPFSRGTAQSDTTITARVQLSTMRRK